MGNPSPKAVRKNKILQAALKIFAEKGFLEATIAEISKAAEVSEATVYEYFKTKEDLLFAIPEEITEEAFLEWKKMLPYFRGTEARLRAIVQAHMNLYQNNPHYSALVMLQLKSNRNFLKTRAYEIIRDIARTLLGYIEDGIADGTFNKETNPYLVRSMILGTIEHLCIRWHLQGEPTNLVELVDPLLDAILDGIKMKRASRGLSLNLNFSEMGLKLESSEESEE